MSNNLVADDDSRITAMQGAEMPRQPIALRIGGKILSFIFHPLFIPVYLIFFYVQTQAHLFSGFSDRERKFLILRFAVIYTMFPLLTILLLKGLRFIKTIYLKTQQERIVPYIICMVYYWWMWYVLKNQPEFPNDLVMLALAIFLVSIGGLMMNIIMKISMHAMSVGVAATFIMLMSFSQDISFSAYISIALLITGLVCTARLVVADHRPNEIYMGLFVGVVCQLVACVFV